METKQHEARKSKNFVLDELRTEVANLRSEKVQVVTYINQLKTLLNINCLNSDENNIIGDLEQVFSRTKEFLLQNSRISEELSSKINDMKRIFDLCSMAKINQPSSVNQNNPNGTTAEIKNEPSFDAKSSSETFDGRQNCKKKVSPGSPEIIDKTHDDVIVSVSSTAQSIEEFIPEPTISGESTMDTCNKGTNSEPLHGMVPLDPLYSDPRRPEARVFHCKCGNNYFSSSAFHLHMITVKFGAAYKCQICKKDYRHLKSLQKHVIKIHERNLCMFLCSYCCKEFKFQRDFRKHLINVHDNE